MRRAKNLFGAAIVLALTVPAFAQNKPPLGQSEARQRILARERWQSRGRRLPGQSSAALRSNALKQKLQLRSAQLNIVGSAAGGWASLGPLPLPSDASGTGTQDYNWVTGRATAVAVDPNDASGNTVFVGGAYGGIWKSTNAGAASANPASVAWIPLADDQATLAIGSIVVQPQLSNPNPAASVVLAGTGETDSSEDSYYGLGILRSSDGGQTWALISQDASGTHPFAGLGFSKIAFSMLNPNLVVAAAASATQGIIEGLENPVVVNRGIYYSTDAGVTWTAAVVSDAGIPISPSSVTSVVYNAAAAQFYAAIRFHGIYSSPDGVNWARLVSQPGPGLAPSACPPQSAQPSACPMYRGEIAVVPNRAGPSGKGEMYVWLVDANDGDQGIWKSLDGGSSWASIDDSGIANCGDALGCGTTQGTFNLALAAVPDGTATDLYAGAVNLYKCLITDLFPSCNGTNDMSFLNLTHVYGCSDIAKVHPGQHEIAFPLPSSTALLYFANDGGVYRALDGYLGLRSGTCGQSNQFDSLNATLGPMTQFVSLAQSATDPNLIFGGTQDNGAPATAFSQSGGPWVNVDAGDNGYTAINPTNDSEWLVSTPPDTVSGVNLFSCPNGVNCHTLDFENNQIADSNELGGDIGPFYLPFVFDPANPNTIVAGTCRIWRGASTGGFVLLSPDFETGGTGPCTGQEVNLVRSIAVGGPVDSSGLSQVIYVGTDGDGPSVGTAPSGGHLWVTTNADAGLTSWTDRTGAINPNSFPVSGVVLGTSDPSGQTAYVAIMGFHAAHVWQTNNAGVNWNDFTGNLPDAPVNSIVIDPDVFGTPSTIYIGTDVGVFSSTSAAPNWTPVDPAQGQPGSLPNVAITALQIFNSGGLKRLRAATYGRGIWEWNLIATPDFQINFSDNPQTVFAGTNAMFSGTITAINGYNSNVSLSCTAGSTPAPQACSAAPSSLVPASGGTPFTLTTGDVAGDYSFNLQVVGGDAAATTHNFALTLHVVDFNLSSPLPSTISVTPGATSAPISFTVSGAFNDPLTLACAGLPDGATCNFKPSTATPSAGNPMQVTLNINTLSSTPLGTSQVTISATTGGLVRTQVITLSVTADYAMTVPMPSLTTPVSSSAVFSGMLASINGYSNSVTLSCGPGSPPTCLVSPASVTPIFSGTPFTVTAASPTAQTYNFSVNGLGSDPTAISHSVALTLNVVSFDFTMQASPQTVSIVAGQSATYNLSVIPSTSSFPNAVAFSCSNLPALASCSFTPTQIATGAASSDVALTITTTPPGGATGSCSNPGTPQGNYDVTLTATSGAVTHSAQVGLTVTNGPGPDFCTQVNPSSASVPAGGATIFTISVSPNNGSLASAVTLSCSSPPPLTSCTFNPPQIAAGNPSSASALTVTTTAPGTTASTCGNPGTPAGNYTVTVTATSSGVSESQQIGLTVTANSDFCLEVTPPTTTSVPPGGTLTFPVDVVPDSGSFASPVTFFCSSLPPLTTCIFSPPQIPAGNQGTVSTLTISTTAPSASAATRDLLWVPFSLAGFFFIRKRPSTPKRRRRVIFLGVLLLGLLSFGISCGGGLQGNGTTGGGGGSGSPGTPAGTYNITVTATCGQVSHNSQVGLTVQ